MTTSPSKAPEIGLYSPPQIKGRLPTKEPRPRVAQTSSLDVLAFAESRALPRTAYMREDRIYAPPATLRDRLLSCIVRFRSWASQRTNLEMVLFVMDWLRKIEMLGAFASLVGVVIGTPALIVGFVQLIRTKKAAEAAADSAKEAVQRVSMVAAVASIEQVCSRSRDLLSLVRMSNHIASARAAFDLRGAIAKFSSHLLAAQLLGKLNGPII